MTDMTMDDLTPENLDRIAKALQKDLLPDDDYHARWCRELASRLKAVIDMFDDGNDVIIQAKLGDQLPRMFEKMLGSESCVVPLIAPNSSKKSSR